MTRYLVPAFAACLLWMDPASLRALPAKKFDARADAAASPRDDALQTARSRFAAAVTNGRLKRFDEAHAQVVFRAAHRRDSDHRPGPMEDDVIAAALREQIAGEAGLQKSGITVRSDAGRVLFNGAPADARPLVRLITVALEIDGVTLVRADLPPALRAVN